MLWLMRLALLCLVLLSPYVALSATYYFDMSASGSDSNPCSQAQPCRNISKANTVAGANDILLFKCGSGITQVADARLIVDTGQKIGVYGTCTPSTLPVIDGDNNHALFDAPVADGCGAQGLIDARTTNISNVTIQGLKVLDSRCGGITLHQTSSNFRLDSNIVTCPGCGSSSKINMSIEGNGHTLTNNAFLDNTKQSVVRKFSANMTITSNTFEDVASDPTLGANGDTGPTLISQNIIRNNVGAGRNIFNIQADGSGGNPDGFVHNVTATHNLIHNTDNECGQFNLTADIANTTLNRQQNNKFQFNTCMNIGGHCIAATDNRNSPDPTDWEELYADHNICWAVSGASVFDLQDSIVFTSQSKNMSATDKSNRGTSAVNTPAAVADLFMNASGSNRDVNLVATSLAYKGATDGVRSLGAMQQPYVPTNGATITTGATNTVCFNMSTVFPIYDITQIASLVTGGSAIDVTDSLGVDWSGGSWISVGGTPRSNTGATINSPNICVSFSGAPATSASSLTYDIPVNKIRAGQVGSLMTTGSLRHYNVNLTGSVLNQISPTGPALASCRTPEATPDDVQFIWDQDISPATGATGYTCTLAGSPWTKDGNAVRSTSKVHVQDFTTNATLGQAIVCSYTPGNCVATTGGAACQSFSTTCTNEVTTQPSLPTLVDISVNNTTPNTLVFTFDPDGFPPMLPTSNCHVGWACVRNGNTNTPTACVATDDDTFAMTIPVPFASDNDTGACTYTLATGANTNSDSPPSEIQAVTNFPITVNFPTAAVVRTITRWRWHEHTKTPTLTSRDWKRKLNGQAEIVPGGEMVLVLQMQVTGNDEENATANKLQCSDDECTDGNCNDGDGAYYDVTTDLNGHLVSFSAPFSQTFADQDPINTSVLGSPGSGSFTVGRWHATATLFVPVQKLRDAYTEEGYSLHMSAEAVPGDLVACRLVLGDNATMAGNPATLLVKSGLASGAN